MSLLALAATMTVAAPTAGASRVDRFIFSPHAQHNHGSCIVECPNGDLLACWYRGSGERGADDVAILGSRLRRGGKAWSVPFILADTPGFPDCNPCMAIDAKGKLWMFWPVILDNQWDSALLRFAASTDYQRMAGAPKWTHEGIVLLKPGPEFTAKVKSDLAEAWAPFAGNASADDRRKLTEYVADRLAAADRKLSMRLGWMPRPHPIVLPSGRLLLPLYSDLFDFSLIAYTDDGGAHWLVGEPIVGPGNVQPSIARRTDGTLVAFFRDNGPPPQRVMMSTSRDDGVTWTRPGDCELPDPGAGLEVLVTKSGRWLLVNNDTENGRHSLAISISDDEGRTWPRKWHLEHDDPNDGPGSYSYPSIIQTRSGSIEITYSYRPSTANAGRVGSGETIRHVSVSEEEILKKARPR